MTRLNLNCITNADCLNSTGIMCILFYNISGLVYVCLPKFLVGIIFLTLKIPPYGDFFQSYSNIDLSWTARVAFSLSGAILII